MQIRTNVDVLILRLNKLKHLPPAWYSSQALFGKGFSLSIVEFSVKDLSYSTYGFPCMRITLKRPYLFPRQIQFFILCLKTILQLSISFMKEGKPKSILAHGLPEYSIGYFLSWFFKVPLICHVHEAYKASELSFLNKCFLMLSFYAMNRSEFLIFPENNRLRYYQKKYKIKAKSYLVFNSVMKKECPLNPDLSIRKQLGISGSDFVYLYLGGIGPENALEEAILALVELPGVSFVVGGWGKPEYVRTLKELTRQCGVESQVFFVGPVKDKWNFYFEADLTHCIYKPERLRLKYAGTASNKLMESIACRVPVLTSQNEDFRELVTKYDFGLCIPQISSGEIAKGIKAFLQDSSLREVKSRNAFVAFQKELNYDSQYREVLKAFENIIPISETAHPSLQAA